MPKERELSGKSYDQQLEMVGDYIVNVDIAPNRRVPGELVFEPMGNGVRVSARDESHRTLWGFVASKPMLEQVHCLVAVYDPLFRLIIEELEKRSLPTPAHGDATEEAKRTIAQLEQRLEWFKKSLQVKQSSAASKERARSIARIMSEALRQISLDSEPLKGMKSTPTLDPESDD
ncbi:MAG: hypothetical protein LAO05_15595 [Acidobacteriia bacterium]|nr:hypothetical protein [Terriglobia bacterium]